MEKAVRNRNRIFNRVHIQGNFEEQKNLSKEDEMCFQKGERQEGIVTFLLWTERKKKPVLCLKNIK